MAGISTPDSFPESPAGELAEVLAQHTPATGRFGGKGRALARLVNGGYPVPPTGVVTVDAYRRVAADPSIIDLVERVRAEEDIPAADVDAVFDSVELPPDVKRAVVRLGAEVGSGARLAVRSSATVEDLHGSSFAGQYRSLLDVDSTDPDSVVNAVRRVWASLWHPAPSSYRRAFGIDESEAAMAVVLMKMIPASTAGVVFTVDPGGAAGARVEAVEGLGESLVSGQRTPEAWVVPVDRLSDKPVPQPPKRGNTLPGPAARALELALEVETFFDVPQDVEWAADEKDVYLVQARPITVLADNDGFDTPVDDHELTTAGIVEMVPGVLPPFRWELNKFILEEAFRSVLDSLGVIRGIPAEDRHFVRRVRGRAAIDFDQLREVASGIPGAASELEAQYFGTSDSPTGQPPASPAPGRSSWVSRVKRELRTLQTRRRVIDQADMVVLATSGLGARRPDLGSLDDTRLLAYLRRLVDLAARGLAAELGVAAAGAASYRRLELLLGKHLGSDEATQATQSITIGLGGAERRPATASASVFAGPTWTELSSTPPEPVKHDEDELARRRHDLEERLKALPGWTRRRILTGQIIDTRLHLIRRTTTDVVDELRRREATKGAILELGGEVRRVMQELAARLIAGYVIVDPADIELLTTSEITAALRHELELTIDTLGRRRNWLSRYEAEGSLPVRFTGIPDREPEPLPEGDVLTGWAASPGRRGGLARVVRSPSDPFERGEVLVAEATDASWSPLFVRAGAIVVERGGPLSHAAILARELGLPAVLNLTAATRVLDGATVMVDGNQGVVVIEDQPAEGAVAVGAGDRFLRGRDGSP